MAKLTKEQLLQNLERGRATRKARAAEKNALKALHVKKVVSPKTLVALAAGRAARQANIDKVKSAQAADAGLSIIAAAVAHQQA